MRAIVLRRKAEQKVDQESARVAQLTANLTRLVLMACDKQAESGAFVMTWKTPELDALFTQAGVENGDKNKVITRHIEEMRHLGYTMDSETYRPERGADLYLPRFLTVAWSMAVG